MFASTIRPSIRHLGHPDHIGIHRCILAAHSFLGHSRAVAAAAAAAGAVEGSRMIHRMPAAVAEHAVPRSPADELLDMHRDHLAGSLLVAAHRSSAVDILHILEPVSL